MTGDDFDFARFVEAQDRGLSYRGALSELRAGRKLGHWIWWVFPRLAGLGQSERSQFYGLSSLAEACAYLSHPVLGPRLHEATLAMLGHAQLKVHAILGADDVKFRSSMTLFALAAPEEQLFRNAIDTFFEGRLDARTEQLLGT